MCRRNVKPLTLPMLFRTNEEEINRKATNQERLSSVRSANKRNIRRGQGFCGFIILTNNPMPAMSHRYNPDALYGPARVDILWGFRKSSLPFSAWHRSDGN